MHPYAVAATAARILRQLRHDVRTLVILTVIPLVILTLLHYLFDERQPLVSQIEARMLVVFSMMIMFLLTAIAMVRERTSGTLERLMTTPAGRADILVGYAVAFGVLALWQAAVATAFAAWVLGLQVAGSVWLVLAATVFSGELGVAFGLLASAISRSEFQAVQMFPVLITPQMLLCGLFGPREDMAGWLQAASAVMPMTYGVEAMNEVLTFSEASRSFWVDLGIVGLTVAVLLAWGSATLQRRTA